MEWFRRKTWTDQDRSEVFARLDRSRSANKAQYARIQAVELIAEPTEPNLKGAFELLTLVLESYTDQTQIALAHHALGNCHELIGHADQAVSSYRNALAQQRLYPGVKTGVHIDFALLVAEIQRRTDYDEALDVLNEFGEMDTFPVSEFKSCAARAFIYSDLCQQADAASWARRALAAAEKTESGFRYHKKLGLVGPSDGERIGILRAILGVQSTL